MFGPASGSNIHYEALIKFGILLKGDMNYLLMDEMKL
jgi:hypothetical protein